jgi:hypothetical protein
MQKLTCPPQVGDRVLCAFEICCGILRSLEAAGIRAGQEEDDERQRHIGCAIEPLRETIYELRAVAGVDPNALAAGFILPGEPPPTDGQP